MKMKKIFLGAAAASFLGFTVEVQAQELPQPSPSAKVEQQIALTELTIEYSRPAVRGRKIFGQLVPYGEIWRTGANKATQLTLDSDVLFAGNLVPAGSYSVFTVPGKKEWKFMINSETELWGAGNYDSEQNVAEFSVKSRKADHKMENMMFYFDNIKKGKADLVLHWDQTKVVIPVEAEYMERAVKNIQTELDKLQNTFRIYNNAASFYLSNDMDPEKALEYAKLSVENEERFWNLKTLSEAYAANGDYKNAVSTAEKALKLAEEANYQSHVDANKENIKKWNKKK